jgi:putative membrane protein
VAQDSLTETELASDTSVRDWLGVFLKGVAMGAADSLPGMSGGTIALITGIYERLITALSSLDPAILTRLPGLHRTSERAAFLRRLVAMDVPFLVVLGVGVVSAIVTVSRVVHYALVEYRALTFAFFFGLIAGSAVVLYREVNVHTLGQVAAGAVGFGFAFYISNPAFTSALPHSPLVILLAGAISITAMILPGVSGAFVLILLGQYEFLTGTLKAFVDRVFGLVTGGDLAALVEPATFVAAYAVGALAGLLSVSRVIRWALDHYRTATLTFLVSLMVGALRTPAEEVLANTPAWTPGTVGVTVAALLAGAGAVVLLELYTDDLAY